MKKPMYKRRAPKRAGVSKKIKDYVKSKTIVPQRSMIFDSIASERLVFCQQNMFFADNFFDQTASITNANNLKFQSQGLKIKYVIHNNSTTVPIICRFLVLETLRGGSETDYKASLLSANISGSSIKMFEEGTEFTNVNRDLDWPLTNNNSLFTRINKEKYRVHRDFNINLGTSPADKSNFATKTLWVPFKRMIQYESTQPSGVQIFPISKRLIVLVLPVEAPADQAVPSTQNVDISMNVSWYYKG
nr:MAG: hypothetical protein [Crogonang virus 119]